MYFEFILQKNLTNPFKKKSVFLNKKSLPDKGFYVLYYIKIKNRKIGISTILNRA